MSFVVSTVYFTNDKNCFATIPDEVFNVAQKQSPVPVFEVRAESEKFFVSSSGRKSIKGDEKFHINGLYGSKLGLKDGSQVIVRPAGSIPKCNQVSIEPMSDDDWEILVSQFYTIADFRVILEYFYDSALIGTFPQERHASFVESHLLDQIRVVWSGQIFPVWVEKSVCIFLKIGKLDPNEECVLLSNETEVIVFPKLRNAAQAAGTKSVQKPNYLSPEDLADYQPTSHFSSVPGESFSSSMSRSKSDKISPSRWGWKEWTERMLLPWFLGGSQPQEEIESAPVSNYQSNRRRQSTDWSAEGIPNGLNFVFRVQPLKISFECSQKDSSMKNVSKESSCEKGDKMAATSCWYLQQSSTVFVNVEDLIESPLDKNIHVPGIFHAKLTRLLSPKDQAAELEKRSSPKKDKDESKGAKTKEKTSAAIPDVSGKKEHLTECVVRVVVIDRSKAHSDPNCDTMIKEMAKEQCCLRHHVIVPDLLRRLLKLDVTSQVWLQTTDISPIKPSGYELHPVGSLPTRVTSQMVQMAFRNWIELSTTKHLPLVIFSGLLVKFPLFKESYMEFQILYCDDDSQRHDGSSSPVFSVVHQRNMNDVKLNVVRENRSSDSPKRPLLPMLQYTDVANFDPFVPNVQLTDLGGISEYAEEALHHVEVCLGVKPVVENMFKQTTPGLKNGVLLITGQKGAGKSAFAQALCRTAAQLPNIAHVFPVDCKPLRGKRPDSILKFLENIFDEAVWRQPSVVLLDDLDHVVPSPSGPEAELSGEAIYGARVAEVIKDILRKDIANNARIAVIATSLSRSSIHPILVMTRGTHFVQKLINIKPPEKETRGEIMKTIMRNRKIVLMETKEGMNWNWLQSKTEGFVARDLDSLVSRALHAHTITQGSPQADSELELSEKDFEAALCGFTPASIRNVPLHTSGEVGWEDVGGLTDVKNILKETLMWPSKYPILFASCPLRLRSGLLLYGAPGTGKTLLAGVVAKECGLNFISIKGPELLSKYIGASEQAVRDMFIRAQSAKPCVLFFDEFDSIAPRRGHDNTGVTDRVVNQLLTQLDGVEGLEGVYVLAATSRPDLIDPALLRPGRLDKCICCDLPNEEERMKIFVALTRKMNIAKDVDLKLFASKCEHFTGADVKALLYNAQLEAIHEMTGRLLKESNSDSGLYSPNKSGRWKKNAPRKSNSAMKLMVKERPLTSSNRKIAYIKKVQDGNVTKLTEEMEDKLSIQVEQIRAKLLISKSTEHVSTSETLFSPVATSKSTLVQISQSQLLAALEKTQPSVNEKERHRYKIIYENFIASRGGNFGSIIPEGGLRQTLA